jgi:parvulin-like peptidyl-prolyl isomerase
MLKSLAREPLVHFLLLGAALFVLDAWLKPAAAPAGTTEIVVGEARIRNLVQNFRRTWQRPPTEEERDGLIEAHVREEVFYREALALGLDRDDAIIRRRLQQKVEFVSEEAAALAKPTDEELAKYLDAHADAFRIEPRATFVQVYLDPRKRGATLEADAKRLLQALNAAGHNADAARAGDGLMLLEPRYENATQAEIARLFGAEFAAALVGQPTATWSGPIRSGYGAHLVRVESVIQGGMPALADVRPLVEREWTNAKRKELSSAFYEKLRAKYQVTVRKPGATTP